MSPFLLKLSESVYLLFPDSPISYQISVPENLPTLSVDPLKLNQALTNLLRNSFESAAQSVSFSVVEKQDCLQIDIINDGASISKEQQTEFLNRLSLQNQTVPVLDFRSPEVLSRHTTAVLLFFSGRDFRQ